MNRSTTSLDFSLFQLKMFLAVAEANSFSRAAEVMHVEQSTLSRRIAVLEQELGFPLFNRESRPIQLTHNGRILYEQWKPLLATFEHTLSMIYSQNDGGTLSICMVDSGVQLNDVPAISKIMRETYPEVTLLFHYAPISQWHDALQSGLCDLAITVGFDLMDMGSQYHADEITTAPKLACFLKSNPLCEKESITFQDLVAQRFVTISDSATPGHAAYVRNLCLSHGFEPVFSGRSSNAHGLTSMLQHDNDVLICDRYLRGLDNPMFKLYELPDTYSELYAVRLERNRNSYLGHFLKVLRDYYNP